MQRVFTHHIGEDNHMDCLFADHVICGANYTVAANNGFIEVFADMSKEAFDAKFQELVDDEDGVIIMDVETMQAQRFCRCESCCSSAYNSGDTLDQLIESAIKAVDLHGNLDAMFQIAEQEWTILFNKLTVAYPVWSAAYLSLSTLRDRQESEGFFTEVDEIVNEQFGKRVSKEDREVLKDKLIALRDGE